MRQAKRPARPPAVSHGPSSLPSVSSPALGGCYSSPLLFARSPPSSFPSPPGAASLPAVATGCLPSAAARPAARRRRFPLTHKQGKGKAGGVGEGLPRGGVPVRAVGGDTRSLSGPERNGSGSRGLKPALAATAEKGEPPPHA